jgi:hypothetical protein
MERKLFLAVVVLAWVVLPLTARNYSRAWGRLPARVAVHFDANWQPNGWTSREGARSLALATTSFLLVVFTIAGIAVMRRPASSLSKWAMVAVFYIVIGLVYHVNQWIVDRSIIPQPTAPVALLAPQCEASELEFD